MTASGKSNSINQELSSYLASRKHHPYRFNGLPTGKGTDAKKGFKESKIEVIESDKSPLQLLNRIKLLFKRQKRAEPAEEELEIKEEEQAELEPTESEKAELENLPKQYGFFKRLLMGIGILREDVDKEFIDESEDEIETLDEDVSEMRDELRQIAKITTAVMSKLSKDELEKFKSSEGFSKFKEILKKYDMIK